MWFWIIVAVVVVVGFVLAWRTSGRARPLGGRFGYRRKEYGLVTIRTGIQSHDDYSPRADPTADAVNREQDPS